MIEHGAFTIAAIQDEAALVIQKTWRGYRLRQSFQERKQLLILHMKRRKETKLKQDEAGQMNAREIMGRPSKDRTVDNEEKFAEIFSKSLCQLDDSVLEGPSSNGIQNYSFYNHGEPDPRSFHGSITTDNKNSKSVAENTGVVLLKDFEQPLNGGYREEYATASHRQGRDSYGSRKDPISYSQSDVLVPKQQFLLERDLTKDRSELSNNDTSRFSNKIDSKTSYTDSSLVALRHENDRSYQGEESRTNQKQVSEDKISERLIVENDLTYPRRPRNMTIPALGRSEGQEKLEKNRSMSFNDNVNVIERTTRLFNALPTPSTSSSSLYSNVADADLKPWQVYKRERHRKHLIRRKIESAVIIQRAFRSHLTQRKNNLPNHSAEEEAEEDSLEHKNGDKDVKTMQEIAALLLQLYWRKYLKRKLMKQQQPEKRSSDLSESRYKSSTSFLA